MPRPSAGAGVPVQRDNVKAQLPFFSFPPKCLWAPCLSCPAPPLGGVLPGGRRVLGLLDGVVGVGGVELGVGAVLVCFGIAVREAHDGDNDGHHDAGHTG